MKNTASSTPKSLRRRQLFGRKLWPLNQQPAKLPAFEPIHLPDDGQVFFKPTEVAIQREWRDDQSEHRAHAIALFCRGEALFGACRYREAAQAYAQVDEAADSVTALQSRGVALMMVSDLRAALKAFDAGASRANQGHSAELDLVCGINLAQVLCDLGKGGRAKDVLRRILDLACCLEDRCFEKIALTRLAFTCFLQASYEEGLAYSDAAIRLDRSLDEPIAQADALFARGVLMMGKGDLITAEEALTSGIALVARDDHSTYTRIRILVQLTSLYALLGRADEAVAASEEALSLCARHAHSQFRARCLQSLALAHWSAGTSDAALSYSSQSLDIDARAGYRRGIARTDLECAKVALGNGQLAVARGFLGEAAETAGNTGHLILLLQSKAFLTSLSDDMPAPRKVAELEQLRETSAAAGLPLMEVLLIQLIGSVYAEMTNYAEAQKSYEMAAARGKEIGCALELAKIHGLQAQLAHRQGDRASAIESAGLADAVLHHAGIEGETVASLAGGFPKTNTLEDVTQ